MGPQSQSQGFGPDPASGGLPFQIQKTLSSMPPEKLAHIFFMAEEMREEEGAYLAPKEISAPETRTPGGFDLMPLVIGGEEWSRHRGWADPARAGLESFPARYLQRPGDFESGRGAVRDRLFRSEFSSRLRPAARRHGELSSTDRLRSRSRMRAANGWSWRSISAWPTGPVTR